MAEEEGGTEGTRIGTGGYEETDVDGFMAEVSGLSKEDAHAILTELAKLGEKKLNERRKPTPPGARVEVTWTSDEIKWFAYLVAHLLPTKTPKVKVMAAPVLIVPYHPAPTGEPDTIFEIASTKKGTWITDDPRSAIWADVKINKPRVYIIEGIPTAWGPKGRGGGVPALTNAKIVEEVTEHFTDAVDEAEDWAKKCLSPAMFLSWIPKVAKEYQESEIIQILASHATVHSRKDIRWHSSIG